MSDFIYNDQGDCVAWIANGEVFSGASKRRIATVRDGITYGLNGEFIGRLQVTGLVRKEGDSTPDAFTRLLNEKG